MIDGTTDIGEAKKWLRTQIMTCDERKRANGQHKTITKFRNIGIKRNCLHCGKEFEPYHPTNLLCSIVCKKERKYEQYKIQYRKNIEKWKQRAKKRQDRVRLKRGTFEKYAKVLRNVGYTVTPPKRLKL